MQYCKIRRKLTIKGHGLSNQNTGALKRNGQPNSIDFKSVIVWKSSLHHPGREDSFDELNHLKKYIIKGINEETIES